MQVAALAAAADAAVVVVAAVAVAAVTGKQFDWHQKARLLRQTGLLLLRGIDSEASPPARHDKTAMNGHSFSCRDSPAA
jgi:hypothetical protein